MEDLPKGKFGNLLRKIHKEQGVDEFIKLYNEIGAIKRLLDLEIYFNEKIPTAYLIGRKTRSTHIFLPLE